MADEKELEAFSNWIAKSRYRYSRIDKRWYIDTEVDTDDLKTGWSIKDLYEEFEKEYKQTN